jgi:hypothetical protein
MRFPLLFLVGQAVATALPLPSLADPITIDFESLASMPFTSRAAIPIEARLSDQLVSSYGTRFSSASPYIAVVELPVGAATSGTKGIGGATANGLLTYAASSPIEVSFWDKTIPGVPAVTDFVSFRLDQWATTDGRTVTLMAYDLNGTFLASSTIADAAGAPIAVTAVGIHRVAFFGCGDDDGAALDDLTFNPPVSVGPTPVRRESLGSLKARYR